MTQQAIFQLTIYLGLILLFVKPLGQYIAYIYSARAGDLPPVLTSVENFFYRCCGIDETQSMDWKQYLIAMLWFNLFGLLAGYLILRLQVYLPFNTQSFPALTPDLALNTSSSIVSNSGWQAYAGEATLGYCAQLLCVTVQNFLSAATGMALLVAFIRGISRYETNNLGNFWIDTVRGVLYILFPLAVIVSVVLISQGVIQNFKPYQEVVQVESDTKQLLPMGPVASLVGIRAISSCGTGFFNSNATHPFENPTPFSNLIQMIAMLLISAALCYSFGVMVKDRRQGWALLLAMILIFIPCALLVIYVEQLGNPLLNAEIISFSEGNMEGKETRLGTTSSALWATITAASANGSVNSMHDSYMPTSGAVLLMLMHLGEIVFGGVGSGLSGLLLFVLISVFISGLMVGRTPEYLGKKIEPYEMKMVALIVLVIPLVILIMTAIASVTVMGISSLSNSGAHGFTQMFYAFTSMQKNNGSAFAGLNANTWFYNLSGTICMLVGRYWCSVATLAVAGSLVKKRLVPGSAGTLTTHNLLFVIFLIGVIAIVGGLSLLPTLALGPIAEHLLIWSTNGA